MEYDEEEDYGDEFVDLGDLQEDLKLPDMGFSTKIPEAKGKDKYAEIIDTDMLQDSPEEKEPVVDFKNSVNKR